MKDEFLFFYVDYFKSSISSQFCVGCAGLEVWIDYCIYGESRSYISKTNGFLLL